MGKFVDLTNQRFGRLFVMCRGEDKFSPNGTQKTMWVCKCDCGNTLMVTSQNLRTGMTESCGCLQKERASESNREDLTGEIFGNLEIIEFSQVKNNRVYWKVRCSCGNIWDVSAGNLTSGAVKSCGCSSKGQGLIDLTGQRYGKLVVKGISENVKIHKSEIGRAHV